MAAAAPRTLSGARLNRSALRRQLLLQRSNAPIPRVLEQMAGLQAQYAPSMYIGLWSRMEGFERHSLTAALERRDVVQATMMRATIHLVSAADYWPLTTAIRTERQKWWLRVARADVAAMRRAADRLGSRLRNGPMRAREIDSLLGKELARGVGMFIDLVRVPPSGTWEHRRADLYAAAEDWLGPPTIPQEEALAHLVRRYLAGFGPASRPDIATWAGLPLTVLDAPLAAIRPRAFAAEDGTQLFDVPRGPLPGEDVPAPARFLPTWDATLLVHARRSGVLAEEHRPKLFSTRTPFSFPTFLVDGTVAGTWRHEAGRINLQPFGRLDPQAETALRAEADGLARFHA
jgi:hypothetical protein